MKNDNSFLTNYAASMYFGTDRYIAGEGFEPIGRSDKPYGIIGEHPVFVKGHNQFDWDYEMIFLDDFNVKKVYKFGEFYDESLIPGMPSIGGTIKFYVDSVSVTGWYLLWAATKLDICCEPAPVERRIIAWTPRAGKDTYRKAGFRLITGWLMHDEVYIDENNNQINEIYNGKYDIISEHRIDISCLYRPQINDESVSLEIVAVFASVRVSSFYSEEELQKVIDVAPDYLKKNIRKNAMIGLPKEVVEWARKNGNDYIL